MRRTLATVAAVLAAIAVGAAVATGSADLGSPSAASVVAADSTNGPILCCKA